jgi:hypothetical protein
MSAQFAAKHWRIRAAEAREVANQMPDGDSRWRMLRIATDYDKVADRLEAAEIIPASPFAD